MPKQTLAALHSPSSPQSASRHRRLFVSTIILVWAVIYVSSIFQPALFDDADTVHAEAAREMATGGDWVTLHINGGFRYLEKAPLMYWCTAASFKVFGQHDHRRSDQNVKHAENDEHKVSIEPVAPDAPRRRFQGSRMRSGRHRRSILRPHPPARTIPRHWPP